MECFLFSDLRIFLLYICIGKLKSIVDQLNIILKILQNCKDEGTIKMRDKLSSFPSQATLEVFSLHSDVLVLSLILLYESQRV